jgi:hypothetical protein
VTVPGNRDEHYVAGRGGVGVGDADDVATRGLRQLGRDGLGLVGGPGSDHHRHPRRGEAAREAAALGAGAAEDCDGLGAEVDVAHPATVAARRMATVSA